MGKSIRASMTSASIAMCAASVLAFTACSSGSGDSAAISTVAPITATAAPCNEQHAVALVTPSTVQVSTAKASGTGIVIDLGVVLTLDHLVARAGALTVSTSSGPYQASVRSEDPANDLALLTVPQLTSPAVHWGDTGGLVAGQRLLALTYSEGQSGANTTRGGFTGIATVNGAEFVRTDAAPDADNTGGPLFTLCGDVVGMNTLSARTGPALAIPSSVLRRFAGVTSDTGAGGDATSAAATVSP
jgi:S1-C subfamily serine protease